MDQSEYIHVLWCGLREKYDIQDLIEKGIFELNLKEEKLFFDWKKMSKGYFRKQND